jgi:hypothetical protein
MKVISHIIGCILIKALGIISNLGWVYMSKTHVLVKCTRAKYKWYY